MRWEVVEQAVDCRTSAEQDPNSEEYIPKSRYATVSNYISNHEYVKDFHNDLDKQRIDQNAYNMLIDSGLDRRLAFHVSSLFIRAPIPVFKNDLMFPCCSKKCDKLHEPNVKADSTSSTAKKVDQNLS